jgi:hypothetical protein
VTGAQKAGEAKQATKDTAGTVQDKAQGAAGATQDKTNQAGLARSLACLRCRITAISTTFTQQTHTL